ncbi:MAG: thioredoxin-disulfide reductase [Candidatus Omnitrophota bacterium]
MIYDVIIIGGGPAGLTASLYSSRARLKTLVIESYMVAVQAVLTEKIENYPGFPGGIGGFELIENFKKQSREFGSEFIIGDVKNIEETIQDNKRYFNVITDDKSFTALSIIIASGAKLKELGVEGEKKFQGRGVSYCATCDGAFFKDKDIVVIGGGDTAVEEALFLTRFGKKVTLIHRKDRLRATKVLQERAFENKKLDIIWDSTLVKILGKDKIESCLLKNIKTNEEKSIECSGVFIFVGYIPNASFSKDILKLDKDGYIITDKEMGTSKKGIFACGDCTSKRLRQVVTACGDGATASFSAQAYVEDLKGIAYK